MRIRVEREPGKDSFKITFPFQLVLRDVSLLTEEGLKLFYRFSSAAGNSWMQQIIALINGHFMDAGAEPQPLRGPSPPDATADAVAAELRERGVEAIAAALCPIAAELQLRTIRIHSVVRMGVWWRPTVRTCNLAYFVNANRCMGSDRACVFICRHACCSEP